MTEIPGYRTIRELGRGAAGTVFLATQESLDRLVALKLLSPDLAADPIASERFLREARTAAHLVHRHIVGVHDVGIHEGQPYLAMEYLPGGTVSTAGVHEPQEALDIVREIALALDHAHAQGVIHRDVKPENILVRADGSHALSDFGIARQAASNITLLTQEGMTAGTPHYMSPEQLQGLPLDGRSDLYGLGVVLYQLLTGKLPYQGSDAMAIGLKHLQAPIPELPEHLARFQVLVNALMAKEPDHRPNTGAEAARMIESIQSGRLPANTSRLFTAPTRLHRWRPWLLVGAGVAVLALAWSGWQSWPRSGVADSPATRAPPAGARIAPRVEQPSIAVLPLVNLSGNPENEYFSDGLAETLLDMLARVPDLKVIARTSSFAFKGKAMDVREIGKTLDATHLLEGSVQQSGLRLRITVQLIRASDGAHLWSQRYDRQMADVFDVQDEVATEIVKAMELALPARTAGAMRGGGTDNVAAYQEYLRGIALLPMRRVQDLQAAVSHFERAIELDPRYAMAYAMGANTLHLLDAFGDLSPAQVQRREQYIRQALQLDPQLGEAYIGRAALLRRSDPVAAERDFKRGLALAPSFTTGYAWYAGWLAINVGRPADAVPLLQRAIVMDPLDPTLRVSLGYMLLALGRIEEAEAIGQKLVFDHAKFAAGHGLQSMVHRARGDFVGELRAIDRLIAVDPLSLTARMQRCDALARAGLFEKARSCPRQFGQGEGVPDAIATIDWVVALWQGDWAGLKAAAARLDDPGRFLLAISARMDGKSAEAVALLRQEWPEWFKNPIGTPNLDNEYQFVEVAKALIAAGDREQARRVLRFGLEKMLAKRRAGSGAGGGRGWTEAMALALLGQNKKACEAMAEATAAGHYEMHEELVSDPLLTGLRKDPCFAPAYARIDALAKAQIAAAEKAGLL